MSHNILIVDDDDITRESLAAILVNKGFHCKQAENGQKALEIIKTTDFDVVISDIAEPHGLRAKTDLRLLVTIAPPI